MNNFRLHTKDYSAGAWYELFSYPAGEMQVRINPDAAAKLLAPRRITLMGNASTPAQFMELALLESALQDVGAPAVTLVLPYLPYSRADRRFVPADCWGLRQFLMLIKSLRSIVKLVTLDAHNAGVSDALCSYFHNVSADPFISAAIAHTAVRNESDEVTLLFPDEGARQRYPVGNVGNNAHEIRTSSFFCSKKRDARTGKLLGFDVPELPPGRPVLIVDDICDGGGTFVGIMEQLRGQGQKVALYTTHSVYSRGVEVLFGAGFDYLYTTNSLYRKSMETPQNICVFDCVPALLAEAEGRSPR
jgi:ribose-phosphate pyrophosphokinase